jgi:hypothetical protein
LWSVSSAGAHTISIAEQDITAPADGELVPVDARGWLGAERAPDQLGPR